jgi:predicted enzyme related to lactoylglutathione lyase
MLERNGYPAGVPCWIDTVQPDPGAAVAFYGGLFGWEFEDRMPAGAGGHYFMARVPGRANVYAGGRMEVVASGQEWNRWWPIESPRPLT